MRHRAALIALLALILVGLLAGSAFAARAQEATPPADLAANKDLARRFHNDIFERGDLAAADAILAPGFTLYSPPQTAFLVGPEAIKQLAKDLRAFYSDMVLSEDDIVAEGDRVVIRWTLTGTAQTESGGIPIVYTGIDIFRIADGKLAELWQNTDDLGVEQQLGMVLVPGTPAAGTPAP
jgi:predicted SnoaL-like aldol condensation-catalyzing enzyme